MAYEIVIPRLGLTMDEGRLVEWYKTNGETVEKGEALFAVETDKAVQDVESLSSGVLFQIPLVSSDPLPIGTAIGYLLEPDEKPPLSGSSPIATSSVESPRTTSVGSRFQEPSCLKSNPKAPSHKERLSSPAARQRAKQLGIDWHTVKRTGDGPILTAHVEQLARATHQIPEVKATRVAKGIAKESGVDRTKLVAKEPGAKIKREDVEAAIDARQTEGGVPIVPAIGEVKSLTQIRRVIAERMAKSAHTTAPVTLTTESDATEVVRLRTQLKDDPKASTQPVPSYNDLLTRLVAEVLVEYPNVNARLDGDSIVALGSVHMGLAVDTERGLIVPVLRDAQTKSLREITVEWAGLVARAQSGEIGIGEIQDSTFTITNLGIYDIDAFTPIINLPECAILGVGRIVPKQVVVDSASERLAIRHMMFLSLTFDHRLIDGAPAARFLQRIKQYIEQPYLWLVT